jgi:trimethylamine--corrinoid protein Co-methyltransferase
MERNTPGKGVRVMDRGFRSQCVSSYRFLTQDQIKAIHRASLEILEVVGIRVKNNEAVGLLENAGCQVEEGNVVHIPEGLVEKCIRSAPSHINVYNRKGEEAMCLGKNKSYFGLGTDLLKTYDLETGELRASCLQDVINAARVADYCEQIDFMASYALPQDVPTNVMYIECFRAMVENSIKPIFFTAAGQDDLTVICEMAAAVNGGEDRLLEKPFLIHYAETTSPLTHSHSGIEKLFLCADRGIPVTYTQGMLAGASGPATLAGAVALANAEALSGVVLHQIRKQGAPIISGLAVVPMDMRTLIFSYGAPEYRLTDAAYADLYHYYGLPMWGTAGCSDSHCLDQQAAAEAAITILMSALSGANLIHDVGYLGQGLIGNPAAIVMCDELIGYVRRMLRGFEISGETIPIDLIHRVGPGGNYLTEEHTLKHHRQEFWLPDLFNRDVPDRWMEKGSRTYGEAVTEKTKQILATHRSEPLPTEVSRQIRKIAKQAEKALSAVSFTT